MLPRIGGANSTLTATFRPDSMDTELTWENMTGGECVALRVTHPRRHTRIKDDYDGDGMDDVCYVYKRENSAWNVLFCIDLAHNGFHGKDMHIPLLAPPISLEQISRERIMKVTEFQYQH